MPDTTMSNHPPIIDTHAHVYPASVLNHLESLGVPSASTNIARNMCASNEPEEMHARLAMMDAAGVDMQVLSATPQVPLIADATAAGETTRMLNDIYKDILDTYPGRFLAYGSIAFNHPEQAIEDIAYCLDDLHFSGIAINAMLDSADAAITDEAYRPVFEELNSRSAILYIHPTGNAAYCSPMEKHGLTWVNGAPVEDGIVSLQLLKADYPNLFPNIRFHIAHLGGDIPFLAQRIEDNYEDWGAFPASPAETLRNMWFDAANFFGPSLVLASQVYDPEKILAGSDYPYFQDEKYARAIQYISEAGLEEHVVQNILSLNALKLYSGSLD